MPEESTTPRGASWSREPRCDPPGPAAPPPAAPTPPPQLGPDTGCRPETRAGTTSPDKRFRPTPTQSEGPRVSSSPRAPDEDCATAEIHRSAPGRFYIVGQLEANIPSAGYQSDSAAAAGTCSKLRETRRRSEVRGLSSSEESWQKLQPVVECGDDAMILVVRRRRAGNLLLDRVNQSSVPLSQLKPQCGYSVQTTWRDLSLMAQYDACHVTREDDRYVLPLLWRGAPVKMSCPVPQVQPHPPGQYSVCCAPYGMTINLQGPTPAEQLSINVRGEWSPLVSLAEQCGFTVERGDEQIVITAPYLTCGMTVKDGKYTLYLQIGENRLLLSCPVSSLEDQPGTRLLDAPHHLSRIRTEPPSEPFPWAAPFYLAPLHYPHPTYQQESEPDAPDVHDPLTPSFSTPDPKFGPQPLPAVESQYQEYYSHQIPDWDSNNPQAVHVPPSSTREMEDLSVVHPDLQQKQGPPVWDLSETPSPSSAAASPAQSGAPSLQPPNHAFNPYYHYYHHPKIPLSHPPQDPGAAPEVPEKVSPTNTYEFLVWPPEVQQSNAMSDPSPPPQGNPHPYIPPSPEGDQKALVSYPYPYPHHYFYYFPHMARGEAKRLTPPHGDMETDVPEAPPLPESTERPVHVEPNQHCRTRPGPPPPPHLYAPYYHYYQMYSGPDDGHASQTSSKDAADPLLQASSRPARHQTTSSPTDSTYPAPNGHLYPYYYYYHHLYQPEGSKDEQEPHPAGSTDQPTSEPESLLPPDSDHSRTDLYPEAGNPSVPQPPHRPVHDLYSQQHLYYAVGPPGGGEAEETLDSDRTGKVFYNSVVVDWLICAMLVSGPQITTGGQKAQSLALAITPRPTRPRPVASALPPPPTALTLWAAARTLWRPTMPPAAHPSEDREASCVLRRLTSDPEVYLVPLDGCGVNKLMFGQTVVHLLEVQGIYSPPDDHTEDSPVRLMVECSSSPGSPGEVRLHVMDQPPPPPPPPPPVQSSAATVTVQLRLSTEAHMATLKEHLLKPGDESFSSFHPEAHLPLSLVRGRPLYLEVSLLEPPEENLVLLVQSCVAHTAAPYTGWMHIYDGCPGRHDSQLLPSPEPQRTRRILISSFLFLPPHSPSYMAAGGLSLLGDPEIFIFCWTEVCSAADGDCTSGCIDSPNGGM
ncbi:unnamed protein product [Pleuronectes platessa]|uniref:ZP domain-containing protein n=1 Tax=Pleuronectes platessa TaxID=8262 RepID=A0A9N7YNK2_PLEPL|nr:unnamed protein product [Pleuronectes platessa]